MKGDCQVIEHLNRILRNRLTASHQYLVHAKTLANWGLESLDLQEYQAGAEHRRFAEALVDRILLLGGTPNAQELDKLLIGEDFKEILEFDLVLEERGCADLKPAIRLCDEVMDFVTREMLIEQLMAAERRIAWLSIQRGRYDDKDLSQSDIPGPV